MSYAQIRSEGTDASVRKVTAQTLVEKKYRGLPITALTAYDYPTARFVDQAGIDMILVGDSLAMTVLGHKDTLSLTMDEMLHHARAARRAVHRAFFVVDMPYGSYHISSAETLGNAISLVKEAGAEAVKIEGGQRRAALVEDLTAAEIPVVGHIGLTPQSLLRMGGYRVQGRSTPEVEGLIADAIALEGAGAVALVLEGIPRELAEHLTATIQIPTIGIGAGPGCDGQILVFHDLFRLTFGDPAKFVRCFGDAGALLRDGLEQFRQQVMARSFPSDSESYHMPREAALALEETNLSADLAS
ncbi:MAG TPA: 3-methyl-2-oxobutanoate hydroxymethyltransferase [Candidatus Aquilonibacter sp.]|nr:3-methyl-2-oxobutanoate hydroxymethyltransferase [Candidatus Aquilonibacter sp.]